MKEKGREVDKTSVIRLVQLSLLADNQEGSQTKYLKLSVKNTAFKFFLGRVYCKEE